MAQYAATGQWAIYSVQRNLSSLATGADHNFLVLVDPQGNAAGGYLLRSGNVGTTAIGSAERGLRIQDLAAT